MPQAEFSLQQRDKIRYLKDRLARAVVSAGGVGVLLALLLIFFYLLSIVLPMFSSASIEPRQQLTYHLSAPVVGMGLDNYGENAYLFDASGHLNYLGLQRAPADTSSEPISGTPQPLLTTQIMSSPVLFTASSSAGWYAYANARGEVAAVQPEFSVSFNRSGRVSTPNLTALSDGQMLLLDDFHQAISRLTLAVTEQHALLVAITEQGRTVARIVSRSPQSEGMSESQEMAIPQLPVSASKLLLTPDGSQLFVLDDSVLLVLVRKESGYQLREVVDLTESNPARQVQDIQLLAGAQSLLVVHNDGAVSQWFDVVRQNKRRLTQIRTLQPAGEMQQLLTGSYRKGFFSFHQSGIVQSHHTTSEDLSFSGKLLQQAPQNAAVSANENYLLTLTGDKLSLFQVDNEHPEITFKSLWQKVWYENYPEPEFVWQSTAAHDDYEAKLSLVPITFGTIKAALFCMLFSAPIAVMGAIYTAYFMTPAMRKLVKPAIELMEALPTVIIGFLAAIWLAPIIESHLPAVAALVICLPLAAVLIGWGWSLLPRAVLNRMSSGWHLGIIIPLLLFLISLFMSYSGEMERALFGGDIRVYLADYGIDFDQRNALVIGIAMGFAVVPTIFTIAEDAVFSVPKHLSDGSLALGATQWQTLTRVVLLTASPGIFSAIMIGLGRAVGETMIVLMATGNTPILDWNMLEGMRTLAATIAVEMPESDVGSSHYRLLFLSALILFVFTFLLNSLAEVVRQRLREKYSSM